MYIVFVSRISATHLISIVDCDCTALVPSEVGLGFRPLFPFWNNNGFIVITIHHGGGRSPTTPEPAVNVRITAFDDGVCVQSDTPPNYASVPFQYMMVFDQGDHLIPLGIVYICPCCSKSNRAHTRTQLLTQNRAWIKKIGWAEPLWIWEAMQGGGLVWVTRFEGEEKWYLGARVDVCVGSVGSVDNAV